MSSPARLSTGPTTPEGKARSSQNARKHGLTSAQFVIAAEDREEFEEFQAELQVEICPQGPLQQILFDQLVAAAWNLHRIRIMEAEITAQAASYADILNNPDLTAKLDRLARHNTRIERSFHRALGELKALQTDAALTPTLPAPFLERALPLASRTQIAKRTQALALGDRKNGVDDFWSGADAEAFAVRCAFENTAPPKTQATSP
jgi:hypothetical protein